MKKSCQHIQPYEKTKTYIKIKTINKEKLKRIREWYENKQLKSEKIYKYGKLKVTKKIKKEKFQYEKIYVPAKKYIKCKNITEISNWKLKSLNEWYENGQLKYKYDGENPNRSKSWYENGQLKSKEIRIFEKMRITEYETVLMKQCDMCSSIIYYLTNNDGTIGYRKEVERKIEEGWDENGQLNYESHTIGNRGELLGFEKIYKNGKLVSETDFDTWERKEWYDNGQLSAQYIQHPSEGIYGEFKRWYENGQLEAEENRNWHGSLDGIQKYWYKNGQLDAEENYFYNNKQKSGKYWYENGELWYEKMEIN